MLPPRLIVVEYRRLQSMWHTSWQARQKDGNMESICVTEKTHGNMKSIQSTPFIADTVRTSC